MSGFQPQKSERLMQLTIRFGLASPKEVVSETSNSVKAKSKSSLLKMDELVKFQQSSTEAEARRTVPTEILAEFLTYIMLKDYEMALKYCSEILDYEPNNSTAKEFYPLILKKLEMIENDELDSLSESSGSDSTTSVSDRDSCYEDAEDTKPSSVLRESDHTHEESDEIFRSVKSFIPQLQEGGEKAGNTEASSSHFQSDPRTLMNRISQKACKPCTVSAPALSLRTSSRFIRGDVKRVLDCERSSVLKGLKIMEEAHTTSKKSHF